MPDITYEVPSFPRHTKRELCQSGKWGPCVWDFRLAEQPITSFQIKAYSHQEKAGAKAKKIKEQTEKVKEKFRVRFRSIWRQLKAAETWVEFAFEFAFEHAVQTDPDSLFSAALTVYCLCLVSSSLCIELFNHFAINLCDILLFRRQFILRSHNVVENLYPSTLNWT